MKQEFIYVRNGIVTVIQFKASANSKLGATFIIGTYHFSIEQVKGNNIRLDSATCLDCPFSYNQNSGKSGGCYTHKGPQLMGLQHMLKRLNKMEIAEYSAASFKKFISKLPKKVGLVRFGVYGEPIHLSTAEIEELCKIGEKTTGYTHQWRNKQAYSKFFMASVSNHAERIEAEKLGYRCFIVTPEKEYGATTCPASKEANRKLTCSECGLCNGTFTNFSKSVQIKPH